MASCYAIGTTSQAILALLSTAVPLPEFANAQFELYQAGSFQNPMAEGVSLYLYRIGINSSRRNHPPRVHGDRRFRPPVPLDLHYWLTAWAKTAERQQRLLGWAIRTLEDTPTLPANFLNDYGPEPDTFRPGETVDLVCDPLSLQDMASLWEVSKVNMQLSLNYVARMLLIDSKLEMPGGLPVQTREFQMAEGGEE